jgi:glycerophosphoryl diester phosphodiesterase
MALDKIREHKMEKRVAVLSFDFRTLAAMRQLAPEIRLSALIWGDSRDFAEIAAEAAHAEIVSPEFHLVTPSKVDAAHEAGLRIAPWTANAPADWDLLIAAKVDAIVTDDPAALIAHLR